MRNIDEDSCRRRVTTHRSVMDIALDQVDVLRRAPSHPRTYRRRGGIFAGDLDGRDFCTPRCVAERWTPAETAATRLWWPTAVWRGPVDRGLRRFAAAGGGPQASEGQLGA